MSTYFDVNQDAHYTPDTASTISHCKTLLVSSFISSLSHDARNGGYTDDKSYQIAMLSWIAWRVRHRRSMWCSVRRAKYLCRAYLHRRSRRIHLEVGLAEHLQNMNIIVWVA
jgi:hypothetical protein